MAIFKSLTFDGINSLDYGIYITGEAVYNAPERVVEMVSVPGRNGDIAIDQGRFENIEVTYPAGCFADSQADFADKVMKFRNALASRYTYKRLTDEYHSDEYRLGLYKSGLDVDAVRYGTAGQFDITFDCKPQRFLLSGETAVTPSDYGNPQTETGEIVTIDSDGSLGVKSLEVSLSPIQSLNGYDKPWSGGANKNLFDPTKASLNAVVYGLTISRSGDVYTIVGTASASGNLSFSLITNYANGDLSGKGYVCQVFDVTSGYTVGAVWGFRTESERAFSIRLDGITSGQAVNCSMKLSVAQTSQSSWTPYSNICPISGHTEVETVVSPTTSAEDGNTYTTSLGRTVYGGTLDVVSGVLTVDRAMVDLGTCSWTHDSRSNRFYTARISELVKRPSDNYEVADSVCSAYSVTSLNQFWSSTDGKYAISITGAVSIRDSKYADLTSFKTAMNGVQLCYELATPQTYQLTPQQIELLVGENNLWSDGEITVEYGTLPYYNPTQFESKPLIVVTGKGVLQIGDYVLTIVGRENQTIYIDCESQEAWEVVGAGKISRNDYIQNAGEEFPVLSAGANTVTLGSGITRVVITPRWWRI